MTSFVMRSASRRRSTRSPIMWKPRSTSRDCWRSPMRVERRLESHALLREIGGEHENRLQEARCHIEAKRAGDVHRRHARAAIAEPGIVDEDAVITARAGESETKCAGGRGFGPA